MAESYSPARWFAVAVVALAIIVGIFVWVEQKASRPAPPHPPITAAERGYLSQIEVAGERMSAASNFLGATVYYLDARLTNHGAKTVREVDLGLTFVDPFGDAVTHRTERPVNPQTSPLKPGAVIPLHLVFQQLPAGWNQGSPTVTVTYVGF
jgi:hypothetical protein